MAASSPPRLFFAAWRVEAFFFSAAFLFGGFCMLHFVSADGQPQHEHVPRESEITQTNATVRAAPRLVFFKPPFGLEKVNPC